MPGIYLEDSQVISALKLLTHTFATVSLNPASSAPTQTPLATGRLGAVCQLRAFWPLLLCSPQQPRGLFPISVPCRRPASPELAIHPPGVHSPGSILVGPWPPQTAGLIGCISRPTGLPLSAFVASVGSGSQLPLSAVTASVESGSQLPLSAVTASVGSGSHPPEGAPFAPFPFSFAVLRVPRCVQLWGVEAAASGFSAFRVLREPQESLACVSPEAASPSCSLLLRLHPRVHARLHHEPASPRRCTLHMHPEPASPRQRTLPLQLEYYAASPVRRLPVLVTVLFRFWRVSLVLFHTQPFCSDS